MADCCRTVSGWSVEVVHLACTRTGTTADGSGSASTARFVITDVRSEAEIKQWLPVASLEPEIFKTAKASVMSEVWRHSPWPAPEAYLSRPVNGVRKVVLLYPVDACFACRCPD